MRREPVDHGAAGDEAQEEGRVEQREVRHELAGSRRWVRPTISRTPSSCAHDGGADEHGLGGGLEGVAGASLFSSRNSLAFSKLGLNL